MRAATSARRTAALAVVAWAACLGVATPAHAAGGLCTSGIVHDDADVLDDRHLARRPRRLRRRHGDGQGHRVAGDTRQRHPVRRPRRRPRPVWRVGVRRRRQPVAPRARRLGRRSRARHPLRRCGLRPASRTPATRWRSTAWVRPSGTASGPRGCWPGCGATPMRTTPRPVLRPGRLRLPRPSRRTTSAPRPRAAAPMRSLGCWAFRSAWRRSAERATAGSDCVARSRRAPPPARRWARRWPDGAGLVRAGREQRADRRPGGGPARRSATRSPTRSARPTSRPSPRATQRPTPTSGCRRSTPTPRSRRPARTTRCRAAYDVDAATHDLRTPRRRWAGSRQRLSAYDTLRDELPARVVGPPRAGRRGHRTARRAADRGLPHRRQRPGSAGRRGRRRASVEALVAEQRHGDAAAVLDRAEVDLAAHRTWLDRARRLPCGAGARRRAAAHPCDRARPRRSPTPTSPQRASSATRTRPA